MFSGPAFDGAIVRRRGAAANFRAARGGTGGCFLALVRTSVGAVRCREFDAAREVLCSPLLQWFAAACAARAAVFSLRAARTWGQSARALHCMTLRTLFDCPRAQKVREATSPLGACGARAINRRGDLQQRLLTTARSRARPARSRRRSSISTRRPRGSGYLPS